MADLNLAFALFHIDEARSHLTKARAMWGSSLVDADRKRAAECADDLELIARHLRKSVEVPRG